MTLGLCAGSAILTFACFAFYGRHWLRDYYACVVENQRHLHTSSLFTFVPWPWGTIALCAALAAACYLVCRSVRNVETAFTVSLVLSLLAAPRLYAYDAAIALPALLVILRSGSETRAPVTNDAAPALTHA